MSIEQGTKVKFGFYSKKQKTRRREGQVTRTFDNGRQIIVEYEGKDGITHRGFILKQGDKHWTDVFTSRKYVIEPKK